MKCRLISFLVLIAQLLWTATAFSQENFAPIHEEDFARWSRTTTLAARDIHRMWRSTSHWANEDDDDSSIELVDVKTLGFRNQILMVVSSGIPKCVTVAVFSRADYRMLWQEDHGSDNYGFCDNLAIPVDVNVTQGGLVEVSTAVYPEGKPASHAVVRKYVYQWNGKGYQWLRNQDSLKLIPANALTEISPSKGL